MPLSPADLVQVRSVFAALLAESQVKISALPAAGSVSRDAVFPIVDASSTQKLSLAQMLKLGITTVPVGQDLRAMDVATLEDGAIFYTTGVVAPNDGGEGLWIYDANSVETDNVGTVIAPDAGVGRFLRQYSGFVNVKWFYAPGDDTHDDTTAFVSAQALGNPIFAPYGTYKVTENLEFTEGGILGEGWGTAEAALKTTLKFYGLTSATSSAISTRQASSVGAAVRFENVIFLASSWDGVTGCSGYGMDIEARVVCRNVSVQNFKSHGMVFHANAAGTQGPYQSYLENSYVIYNGGNGIILGSGANAVTFVNPVAYWNGAPSYGVAPSVAGNFDGFVATSTITTYPMITIEALSIIGGDCSYNSRQGWNFNALTNSCLFPGYAEGNLGGGGIEAKVNEVSYCDITFQALAGREAGLSIVTVTEADFPTNRIKVGGAGVFPAVSTLYKNYLMSMGSKKSLSILSSVLTGEQIYWNNMNTPDNTVATEPVVGCLRGSGNYGYAIGSGDWHMKVKDNFISLPYIYAQQSEVAGGWSSDILITLFGDAPPPSGGRPAIFGGGNWLVGDRVINQFPAPTEFDGWRCTTAGSPGTWKGYGAIEP